MSETYNCENYRFELRKDRDRWQSMQSNKALYLYIGNVFRS